MGNKPRTRFWRQMEFKISAFAGGCIFCVISLLGLHNFIDDVSHIKEDIHAQGKRASKILAISATSHLISNDLAELEKTLIQSVHDDNILSLAIIHKNGDTISKISNSKGMEPVADYTFSQIKMPTEIIYQLEESDNSITVWRPINIIDHWGWMKIVYSKQRIYSASQSAWQQSLVSSSIVFLVSILALHLLLKPHLKSIHAVTEFSKILRNNHGEQMKVHKSSFEIENLTTALNLASASLYQQSNEITENRAYIQLLLDSINQAVFGVDKNKQCTFINRSGLNLLGYSGPDEVLGKDILKIITTPVDNTIAPENDVYQYIYGNNSFHDDKHDFTRKNGQQFPVEYWSNPISKGNEIIGNVVTFTDISSRIEVNNKRQQLEKQLQQAQKMESIGQLTGGIAHDFNNILAYVLGYIELTLDLLGDSTEQNISDYLHEAHSGGVRAQELVAQMLAFGRKIDGKVVALRLEPMINEIQGILSSMLPSSIVIESDIQSNLEPIMIDATQLQQVLMNLCINAKDAMAGHGAISIKLGQENIEKHTICNSCHHSFDGEYQVLTLNDTGEGMEPENLEKIFEPFFTTKDVGKGSGMGLSMVHGLLHERGGHIQVTSTPGQGTEFKLYFPLGNAIL